MFETVLFIVAVLGGAVAAVSGFGIGSLLTPLLALQMDTKLAVALVALPHFIGTGARFLGLRKHVDRRVLINFGIMSAAGGLAGALLNAYIHGKILTIIFACLLLFAGISGLAGLAERIRLGRKAAWTAGGLSGFFGGLVGNQGGIRSAALLGFSIPKESFVATATAIGLVVDVARLPVYYATQWNGISSRYWLMAIAAAGVLAGTLAGVHLLRRMPERIFRFSVSILITLLGGYMFLKGLEFVP